MADISAQSTAILEQAFVAADAGRNTQGYAWPGEQTLADELGGCSRRHVRNGLDVLEAAGIIVRSGKVGRAIRYRITP